MVQLEPDALRDASVWMKAFGQMDGLDLDAFERFLEEELPDAQKKPEPSGGSGVVLE